MRAVYKYILTPEMMRGPLPVLIPMNSKFLRVDKQGPDFVAWFEVDTRNEPDARYFQIFGTGWQIATDMGISKEYLGTFYDGSLVFHLYEVIG